MRTFDLVRIVDDDPDIREAVLFLLEGEGLEARAYPSAEDFLAEEDFSRPGCVVLDVQMPGKSGLDLQEDLARIGAILPIVFVSAHGSIEMAVQAMRDGAFDFIAKPADMHKLLCSVKRAIDRCHEQRQKQMSASAKQADWDSLTAREKEVARLLAQGIPNKVIADRLQIANRTVQVHRATIYMKLGVRSAAEITMLLQQVSV
jgi:FixJ family two-component response regulator